MNLRTSLAPALLGLLTLAPLAAASATAPAGGDASAQTDAPAGDAPATVDITNLHVFKTTKDYRAVVTYSDLTPRNATRWFVEFYDTSDLSGAQRAAARRAAAAGLAPTAPKVNLVELRRNRSGTESSFGYKINSDATQQVRRATCSLPQTATPDYDADTITFVVPRRCWKPTSGTAAALTGASQYDDDTYDGTAFPSPTSDENDFTGLTWNYRPSTNPSPSPSPSAAR